MVVQTKEVTLYHVTGHQPLQSPGNDEVDALASICWLEEASAEETAAWLHQKTKHMGQQMFWAMVKALGLPLRYMDVVATCQECPLSTEWQLHHLSFEGGQPTSGALAGHWATAPLGGSSVCYDLCGHCYKPSLSIPKWKGITTNHHPGSEAIVCCLWHPGDH